MTLISAACLFLLSTPPPILAKKFSYLASTNGCVLKKIDVRADSAEEKDLHQLVTLGMRDEDK